jgi:hypothetical protein
MDLDALAENVQGVFSLAPKDCSKEFTEASVYEAIRLQVSCNAVHGQSLKAMPHTGVF